MKAQVSVLSLIGNTSGTLIKESVQIRCIEYNYITYFVHCLNYYYCYNNYSNRSTCFEKAEFARKIIVNRSLRKETYI